MAWSSRTKVEYTPTKTLTEPLLLQSSPDPLHLLQAGSFGSRQDGDGDLLQLLHVSSELSLLDCSELFHGSQHWREMRTEKLDNEGSSRCGHALADCHYASSLSEEAELPSSHLSWSSSPWLSSSSPLLLPLPNLLPPPPLNHLLRRLETLRAADA